MAECLPCNICTPCKICGHSIARNTGYVVLPSPWGVDVQHKAGQCMTPKK